MGFENDNSTWETTDLAADDVENPEPPRPGLIRSPENLAGGALLLVLGGIGFLGTAGVSVGTLAEFGAGMVPRAVSALVACCGLALMVLSLTAKGLALERWHLRGLLCILGAVLAFAVTLRGFDFGLFKLPALGLAIAGPLAVTLAALADHETRVGELLIFAVGLTALCIVLFRFILRLPIPIAPWALGY
jgi:hypothetical protein